MAWLAVALAGFRQEQRSRARRAVRLGITRASGVVPRPPCSRPDPAQLTFSCASCAPGCGGVDTTRVLRIRGGSKSRRWAAAASSWPSTSASRLAVQASKAGSRCAVRPRRARRLLPAGEAVQFVRQSRGQGLQLGDDSVELPLGAPASPSVIPCSCQPRGARAACLQALRPRPESLRAGSPPAWARRGPLPGLMSLAGTAGRGGNGIGDGRKVATMFNHRSTQPRSEHRQDECLAGGDRGRVRHRGPAVRLPGHAGLAARPAGPAPGSGRGEFRRAAS